MAAPSSADPPEKPVHLTPNVGVGKPPPFHELDEYIFQDLCRDLLDADRDILHCDVYGRRGQGQQGIDLIAPLRENAGYDVGQCKRYQKFSPADIQAASNEFFKYWDYWSKLRIRRFILFVACDVSGQRQQAEIIVQRERFKERGVEYAVWAAAKLRNLLRPHPGLVASYFKNADFWVREICGPDTSPTFSAAPNRTTELRLASTESMLGQLAEHLSGQAAHEVEKLRDAWREGRTADAREGVRSLKANNVVWSVLSPEAKARVLRFEASLVLDTPGGLDRARGLAAEARNIAPADDHGRIDALIALRTDGAAAALQALGNLASADARHLAAALLINLGRASEALEVADAERHAFAPSAETFRVQALAYAAEGDLERARLAIQRALEMAPLWEGVRSASGIIEYLGVLSPGARPKGIPGWPMPPGWSYVQRDDDSLSRLRMAADRFRSLCVSTPSTVRERYVYETWELACLANDPERQEEAALRCRTLLEGNPTHAGAIAWALGRSYDIDKEAVELALANRIEDETTETQAVVSLAMCLLAWERPADAVSLLDASRPRFDSARETDLWTFWRAQAALAIGEDAPELLEGLDADDRGQLELLALRVKAERTGEWGVLASAFIAEHERTGYAPYLFEACLAWARGDDWPAVAERADLLVSAVGTAEAVRLAAFAAQNARRAELAVRLLDENSDRFPHCKLPHDLRALRARALYAQGELMEAIAEARDLAREEPTLINDMRLAHLLSTMGDLSQLVALARQIAKREDLGAEEALSLARTIAVDDAALASRLWRTAMRRGVPDEAVAPALDLAYRLGLDDETRPLIERMDRLAREGLYGNRVFEMSELPAFAAARKQTREQATEAYRAGAIPVHLFADQVNVPLAVLYRHSLVSHERDPHPALQFALRAQHGMRALTAARGEVPRWRLHADITALLLAAHLGILERVEETFGTIWIPDRVIFELARMRAQLAPNQPKRLEHTREVVELADAGRIASIGFTDEAPAPAFPWAEELGAERAGMLARAMADGGYVLDHLPLRSSLTEPPPDLPEEYSRRFIDAPAVVAALRHYGPLSRPEQRRALRALGAHGSGAAETALPEPGYPLYCHGNTAETLASAGVLRPACERFRVAVDTDTLRTIRAEQEGYDQRASDVRWLSELIEHLSRGQSEGRYRIIPPRAVDEGEEENASELYGLGTLLRLRPQPGDAVWVDDRWSTGHWTRLEAPVVGIVEVLRAMRRHGTLDRATYYELLLRLRAANVWFVPISAHEIVHHLLRARVDANRVVETHALTVLRRYTAAWLDEAEWLDRPMLPDGSPNPKSEMPLLMGLARAVTGAIWQVIVRGKAARHERLARARWIMENLYVDHTAIRRCAALADPGDDSTRLAALSAVGLLVHGLSWGWGRGAQGRNLRRRYLGWVSRYVLRPRADADRLFLPLVAEFLKNISPFDLSDTDLPEPDRIILRRRIYDDLPRRLRDELIADPVIQAKLAMERTEVVTVGRVNVERAAFIHGAAEAVNGRVATALISGTEQVICFEPQLGESVTPGFRITGMPGGEEILLTEEIFGVLSESAAEREAVLRRNSDWFDGPSEGFDAWIAAVASTEDALRRFAEAESGRDGSPTLHYWKRLNRLRARHSYRWADLSPPPIERLLRYFRIESAHETGRSFRRALSRQADALIADDGLELALERWAGLPVPLPSAFMDAVARLERMERRKLIKRLLETAGSPVSDLHLIRLLWNLRTVEPAFGRLALRRACALLEDPDEGARFSTFRTVLRWVGSDFALRPDVSALPAQLRLALVWLHSHRLFALFKAANADMVRLGATFRTARHRLSPREFSDDPAYQYDAAVPLRLERLPFLLAGLSHAFAGDDASDVARRLSQAVDHALFIDSDGTRVPHLLLLRNPSLTGDVLGSFLHCRREREIRALLPPERIGLLSSKALLQFTRHLLKLAGSDASASIPWVHLWAVMGDLPRSREIAAELAEIIHRTDFPALVARDPAAGGLALQTAAAAASHDPSSEIRAVVREAILAVARDLAERFPFPTGDLLDYDGPVPAAPYVIQAAVEFAKRSADRWAAVGELTDLLAALIGTWPALAEGIGGFAQRAWEELPSGEAQFFGDLAIKARSLT